MLDMKFTKAERSAILAGWAELEQLANTMSCAFTLKDNLRLERRALNEPVPKIVAKGLIIGWVLKGIDDPAMPLRYMFAWRAVTGWSTAWGCFMAPDVPGRVVTNLRTALAAYDDASSRYFRVLK